ncbi:MAG: hypothetical protein GY832_08250 [Chloroflexi bacterium]|nr:hypothetical protein [Chloroflexota bacterium]
MSPTRAPYQPPSSPTNPVIIVQAPITAITTAQTMILPKNHPTRATPPPKQHPGPGPDLLPQKPQRTFFCFLPALKGSLCAVFRDYAAIAAHLAAGWHWWHGEG